MSVNVGDAYQLSITFTDALTGVPVNPDTVTFMCRPPVTPAVLLTFGTDAGLRREQVGSYRVILTLSEPGEWFFKWKGTGEHAKTEVGSFTVNADEFDTPTSDPLLLIQPGDLRHASQVDLAAFSGAQLLELLQGAQSYLEEITGRYPFKQMPERLLPLARVTLRMRAEQMTTLSSARAVRSQVNVGGITNFSVPGYSESRSVSSSANARGDVLNAWPELADNIWLLMTPERRVQWLRDHAANPEPEPSLTFATIDQTSYIDIYDVW